MSVILGQLTRCEKSFVPAKKFVVEGEREEIETQDSFKSYKSKIQAKGLGGAEEKDLGYRGKEREITLWKLIKKSQQT